MRFWGLYTKQEVPSPKRKAEKVNVTGEEKELKDRILKEILTEYVIIEDI